jgi:hypothetical protein
MDEGNNLFIFLIDKFMSMEESYKRKVLEQEK